jgi:hypothetical protein
MAREVVSSLPTDNEELPRFQAPAIGWILLNHSRTYLPDLQRGHAAPPIGSGVTDEVEAGGSRGAN